jgi:hypothetical protein
VSAAKVLTDDHVLNGFTGSGHVHGVRKVFPLDTRIGSFFLEDFVSLVTDFTRDIIGLGRTTSRVDEHNSVLSDTVVIEGTSEKLIVSTVDRVTALKGDNILVIRETGANFLRSLAGKVTNGQVQTSDLTSHVVLSTFRGNHERTRVLNFGSTIALEALQRLIGEELVSELNRGNGAVSLLEENRGTRLQVLAVGIENNRKSKDGSIRKFHLLHNALVRGFVHESFNGRETPVHDKLDIAQLTVRRLEFDGGLGNSGLLFLVRLDHQIDKLSSVRDLLGSHELTNVFPK